MKSNVIVSPVGRSIAKVPKCFNTSDISSLMFFHRYHRKARNLHEIPCGNKFLQIADFLCFSDTKFLL